MDLFHGYDRLKEEVPSYIKTRISIVELTLVKKAAEGTAEMLSGVLSLFFILMITLFASFALALYLGDAWGSYWLGFLAISAGYVVAIVLYRLFFRSIIRRKAADNLVNKLLNDGE